MENGMALLVSSFEDIFKRFKDIENKWHSDPNGHSAQAFKDHVEGDCEIYGRMLAFQDELVKEAARQNQVTVAEIEGDARAYENDHPGV